MLMEVLAKSTYTSLTVLSVAIMPPYKPALVKCLANVSQIMRCTQLFSSYPAAEPSQGGSGQWRGENMFCRKFYDNDKPKKESLSSWYR